MLGYPPRNRCHQSIVPRTSRDHENLRDMTENQSMKESRYVVVNDHRVDAGRFRAAIIAWGRTHFRSFPWRGTDDPYRLLVAEVMLHRTRAPQVLPVYERFVVRYPDVDALARATKDDLHAALASLGLRQRVDMLYAMTLDLAERFDGRVPEDKDALLSLPGVSDYIAGAVRCFSRNEPEPLVDTNTVRVVGRLFGLKATDSSRRNRVFKKAIAALVYPGDARAYNYALLDLANLVCTKVRPPRCFACPVRPHCRYGNDSSTSKAEPEA